MKKMQKIYKNKKGTMVIGIDVHTQSERKRIMYN